VRGDRPPGGAPATRAVRSDQRQDAESWRAPGVVRARGGGAETRGRNRS
jgi:hypothetical protein